MASISNEDQKRGQRLRPNPYDRNFWVLENIRDNLKSGIESYIDPSPAAWRIVDYGCGNMPYRELFKQTQPACAYEGHDFPDNDLADRTLRADGGLDLEAGTADVVVSSQVLEHVPDPGFYLQESFRALRKGGKLFLTTHGVWRFHPDPTDFWRWTSAGLQKQVQEAGFAIVCFRGMVGPAATGIQLFQDAVLPRVPVRLRKAFCFMCQRAMRFLDARSSRHTVDADACTFFCVAGK